MSNSEELLKNANIQEIAEKGAKIYETVKAKFEPQENGKFLAIDIGSGDAYLANTSSEAVQLARKAHPDTVFYIVKVGYSVAEALADMGVYAHGSNH